MNFESQNVTGVSTGSKPVWLKNHTRKWNVNYDHLQFCALGVYKQEESQINAVLFSTDNIELFDLREHGYTRHQLDRSEIIMWDQNEIVPDDAPIWIYYPEAKNVGQPGPGHFIWQSYVDVIIMGCLSFNKDFAQHFISTTFEWNKSIFKNDRLTSEYLRRLTQYSAEQVDEILILITE